MRFSVVMVNYASWTLTQRCVESLRATGYEDYEVVVVDNDRRDPPALDGGARLIRNPENAGFARACNQGIEASNGELVVLLNPDTIVEEDFFEALERFFGEYPGAGIAGPRVLDADGKLQLSARRELGPISGLVSRTSLLTKLLPDSAAVKRMFPATAATSSEHPAPVDWVSGACLIARREVMEKLGGLDERFFMYFEDADLCRRARKTGWTVYYLPGVSVTHNAGGSTASKPRAIWRLHKSAFLYHRKHDRHGPLNLYSVAVLAGLCARAAAKLAASSLSKLTADR